jgi:hypothetical protein
MRSSLTIPSSACAGNRIGYVDTTSGLLGADDESKGLERVLKVQGGGLVWFCASCGARNDVRTAAYSACGRSFVATARRIADEETTDRARAGDRAVAESLRNIAARRGPGPSRPSWLLRRSRAGHQGSDRGIAPTALRPAGGRQQANRRPLTLEISLVICFGAMSHSPSGELKWLVGRADRPSGVAGCAPVGRVKGSG